MIITVNKDRLNEFMDEKNISKIKNSIIGNIQLKRNIEKINELLSNKLNNFINLLNQDNLDISLLSDDIIIKQKNY